MEDTVSRSIEIEEVDEMAPAGEGGVKKKSEDIPKFPVHKKKVPTKQRHMNSIYAAMEPGNYDSLILPADKGKKLYVRYLGLENKKDTEKIQ